MQNNQLLILALQQAQSAIGSAIQALQQPQTPKPTPRPTPKPRGNLGLVRQCLAGCNYRTDKIMYNTLRKDGTRRLKIWDADYIFNSPESKKAILWDSFAHAFGDRFVKAMFHQNPEYLGGWHLAITVKDKK